MKLSGIWLWLLLSTFIQPSWAQESPRQILVVRPEGSWPPWEITIDGKEPSGVHIEMIQAVAKNLNISLTIKTYPWKRAIAMLRSGRADAITYMSKTEERAKFGYFIDGNILSVSSIGFFVLKKNSKDIQFTGELTSLQQYTIGTCRGYSYHTKFDNAEYLVKDDGAADESILVKKLIAGRVKIAIGYVDDVNYHARQLGLEDQLVFLQPLLSKGRPTYLVFSKAKQHKALAQDFARGMIAFKSSQAYRDLLAKYGITYAL